VPMHHELSRCGDLMDGWPSCQMDYINTSHPGFIGGSKAVEIALNQQRGARALASKVAVYFPFDPFSALL
jgi:hypothetical protein